MKKGYGVRRKHWPKSNRVHLFGKGEDCKILYLSAEKGGPDSHYNWTPDAEDIVEGDWELYEVYK